MKILVVHTPNQKYTTNSLSERVIKINWRFGNHYWGDKNNYDRLTIVGVPNEETKELSIGISFCSYPDNFSKKKGYWSAYTKAYSGGYKGLDTYRPYVTIKIEDFTQKNCLELMYEIHAGLVKRSVKEVKKLLNHQIVK